MRRSTVRVLVSVCAVVVVPVALDLPATADDVQTPTAAPDPAQADFFYDVWNERWGQSLADVPVGATPESSVGMIGGLESPRNVGDQYSTRLRTLFTPIESGDYRFFVAGDDDARLFLNPTGSDPAGSRLIGYVAGWTTFRQWDRYAGQRSDWFHMEAGNAYYLEAIGKEGSGDDSLSVGMQRTESGPIEVVPASLVAATTLGGGGWRVATPDGLPDVPSPLSSPGWVADVGIETLAVTWQPVDGADRYAVRLEGGGQVRTVETETPAAAFDRLVPDTRYLLEVAPMNAAGRQAAATGVWVTSPGPYPTPIAPAAPPADARPTVSYDRWSTGWWTLTSIPDGLAPASTGSLSWGFETPPMLGENHAARLRAVLTPRRTDDYTFHLSADDDARLLFNPDGVTAAGAKAVASVAGWTQQYQWDRYDSQTSATFRLQAGRSYYLEAISVHGLGLDHLEVGWSVPGSAITVIPADVLTPTHAGAGGWRRDATELPSVPGKPKHLVVDESETALSASWEAPTVDQHHGATVFYEVTLAGEGIDRRVLTPDTSVVLADLPAGGRFWIEVVPWNESGRGNEAAFTVHTDKPASTGPGGNGSPPAAVDVPDAATLSGKKNDRGDVVNQLGPVGVFEAPGAEPDVVAARAGDRAADAAVEPGADAVRSGVGEKSVVSARSSVTVGVGSAGRAAGWSAWDR